LTAFVFVVALISCSEQDKMTGPDQDGNAALNGIEMLKGSNGAPSPTISSISPTSVEIGDVLTINGNSFGPKRGSGFWVTIDGKIAAMYQSWSRNQIKVIVPSGGVPNSSYQVTVNVGTSTSNAVSFTLLASTPVTIGQQTWMGANLDVANYRSGDPIPQVTDPTVWIGLTTGAWCYPNNDPVLGTLYGKLYNWYAVNDPRGLAPSGWHVATETEWKNLFMYLGMSQQDADGWGYPPNAYYGTAEGGMLKERGTSLWEIPNTGATNSTGFTALPGGYRNLLGDLVGIYRAAGWWTATEYNAERAWMRLVVSYQANTYHNNLVKHEGWSVRCIQNN
jgi:uncharacterized protein (TIGR02145 family)